MNILHSYQKKYSWLHRNFGCSQTFNNLLLSIAIETIVENIIKMESFETFTIVYHGKVNKIMILKCLDSYGKVTFMLNYYYSSKIFNDCMTNRPLTGMVSTDEHVNNVSISILLPLKY